MKVRLISSIAVGVGLGLALLWTLTALGASVRADVGGRAGLLATALTFAPDLSTTAQPGTQVLYVHTLAHDGSTTATYHLAGVSSRGWQIVLARPPVTGTLELPISGTDSLSVTLGPAGAVSVAVAITVPSPAVYMILDQTVVTATSVMSPSVFASVTDRTRVGLALAPPELGPDSDDSVRPGGLFIKKHILVNDSNAADTFSLQAWSEHGWEIVLGDDPNIGPYAESAVYAFIVVPVTVPFGLVDRVIVTATSALSPNLQATAVTMLTVRPAVSATLSPAQHKIALPGQVVSYTHVVTNHGAIPAFITFEAASAHSWEIVTEPLFRWVPETETTTVEIALEIPAGLLEETTDEIVLTATVHTAVATAEYQVVDTTTAQVYALFLPLVSKTP